MNKRFAFFLVLALAVITTSAQQLKPLPSRTGEQWRTDMSELVYIATRCGCLLDLIGNYATQNSLDPKGVETGKQLSLAADTYLFVAVKMGPDAKLDEKATLSRHKSFVDIYSKQMQNNKKINNDIFDEKIKNDFDFCASNFGYFKALSERLN